MLRTTNIQWKRQKFIIYQEIRVHCTMIYWSFFNCSTSAIWSNMEGSFVHWFSDVIRLFSLCFFIHSVSLWRRHDLAKWHNCPWCFWLIGEDGFRGFEEPDWPCTRANHKSICLILNRWQETMLEQWEAGLFSCACVYSYHLHADGSTSCASNTVSIIFKHDFLAFVYGKCYLVLLFHFLLRCFEAAFIIFCKFRHIWASSLSSGWWYDCGRRRKDGNTVLYQRL